MKSFIDLNTLYDSDLYLSEKKSTNTKLTSKAFSLFVDIRDFAKMKQIDISKEAKELDALLKIIGQKLGF